MIEDLKESICQKLPKLSRARKSFYMVEINPELQSIPIPSEVMKQIGADIFSKWSEAKAIKDKSVYLKG